MLILTRKKTESVMIGTDIVITIMEVIGSDKVRIGIKAPRSIPVHREEVFLEIEAEGGDPLRVVHGCLGKCESGGGHVPGLEDWVCQCSQRDAADRITHIKMNKASVSKCDTCGAEKPPACF